LLGVLKAHEIEDFTSLGINNALIPILKVQDLDRLSSLLYFKTLPLLINIKLFEVTHGNRLFFLGIRLFIEYIISRRFHVLLRLVLMFLVAQHDNTEIIGVEWVRIEGLVVPLRVVKALFVQGDLVLPLLKYRGLGSVLLVGALEAIDFVPFSSDA
jgi:hypothetical protein